MSLPYESDLRKAVGDRKIIWCRSYNDSTTMLYQEEKNSTEGVLLQAFSGKSIKITGSLSGEVLYKLSDMGYKCDFSNSKNLSSEV